MDGMLFPLVLTMHIIVGLSVIGLVLLQHGKGADMGAAFGSGASGSLFGASGSANFMSRTTAVLAAAFFLTSLSLSYMASNRGAVKEGASVMDSAKIKLPTQLPATPANPVPEPLGADSKAKEIPK
jgi:preprotein translocase subunit SecG